MDNSPEALDVKVASEITLCVGGDNTSSRKMIVGVGCALESTVCCLVIAVGLAEGEKIH